MQIRATLPKKRCIFFVGLGEGHDLITPDVKQYINRLKDFLELSDDYENVFVPTSDDYGVVRVQFDKD